MNRQAIATIENFTALRSAVTALRQADMARRDTAVLKDFLGSTAVVRVSAPL